MMHIFQVSECIFQTFLGNLLMVLWIITIEEANHVIAVVKCSIEYIYGIMIKRKSVLKWTFDWSAVEIFYMFAVFYVLG